MFHLFRLPGNPSKVLTDLTPSSLTQSASLMTATFFFKRVWSIAYPSSVFFLVFSVTAFCVPPSAYCFLVGAYCSPSEASA
jgi:hypothetical protein